MDVRGVERTKSAKVILQEVLLHLQSAKDEQGCRYSVKRLFELVVVPGREGKDGWEDGVEELLVCSPWLNEVFQLWDAGVVKVSCCCFYGDDCFYDFPSFSFSSSC